LNKAVFLDRDGTINEDVGDFCSQVKPDFIANDLYEAAFWIIGRTQTQKGG